MHHRPRPSISPITLHHNPGLAGQSVVYVLQVPPTACGAPCSFYVGETEGVSQRLRQHRAKEGWNEVEMLALAVKGGKSSARSVETKLINALKECGALLVSEADGSHRLFSS